MPNGLISILAVTGIILALSLLFAVFQRGRVAWRWLAAGLVLIVAHDALITGSWGLTPWPAIGDDWNWSGKIAATVGTLAIAALPVIGWRRSGITLKHDRKGLKGALILSAVVVAAFTALALYFPSQDGDAEGLIFQLTMPGIEEELFYRGVLLLILNEAFGRPLNVLGAPMGWAAVLTSLVFGLDHALGYGAEGFRFDPLALALTGGPALLLVWIRERSGSLLLPVLLHNYANSIFRLI